MSSFQYLVILFNHIMVLVFFIGLFGKLVVFYLEEGSGFISLLNWVLRFQFFRGIFRFFG